MPKAGALPAEQRRERLAVNVYDLTTVHETVRQMLLAGKISTNRDDVIWVDESRVDETATPFVCPLIEAACIADVLRGHNRKTGDAPVRVYVNRGKGWTRLPGTARLTSVEGGRPVLNPEIFAPAAQAAHIDPPPFERVSF